MVHPLTLNAPWMRVGIIGAEIIVGIIGMCITKKTMQIWNKNCSQDNLKISDTNIELIGRIAGAIIAAILIFISVRSMDRLNDRIYILNEKFGKVTPELFDRYVNIPIECLKQKLDRGW